MIERLSAGFASERNTLLLLLLGGTLFAVLTASVMFLPPMFQIAMVVAGFAVVAFFLRPSEMFLAFFIGRLLLDLLWWVPGSIGSLNLMELFTGGVSALAGVLVALQIKSQARHPAWPAILPYAVVLLFGGIRNLELRSAAEIMVRYMSPILVLLLMTALMDTRDRRRRIIMAMLIVSAIPIVVGLIALARGQMNTYMLAGYARLKGGYQNLHNHALMMFCIAAMGLFHMERARQAGRLRTAAILALYVGGAMVCLYLTYVRTALLALVACGAVYLYITRRHRILMAGAVMAVLMVLVSDTLQDRFKDLVLFFFPDDSVLARRKLGSGRMTIWTAGITAYFQAPIGDILLGLGIGKHWLLTRGAFNPYAIAAGGYVDPHSDYLTMTFQVGPIATLSYIALQVQAARIGVAVYRKSPDSLMREWGALTVGIVAGATVANMVSNAFINRVTVAWVLWGTVGITVAEYLQLIDEGRIVPRSMGAISALRSSMRWRSVRPVVPRR